MTSSHIHMKRIGLLLLAGLALAAAGCGSSSSSSSSSSTPAAPASSTANSTASSSGAGKTVTITMKNIQFNPTSQTVKVGTPVKWVNEDTVPHNVQGGPLHSSTFGEGGSYEFTPKTAGTITYVCTIHPNMKATLKVTS
ncbi:MAG: plastocyanin [Actinobacteria bacterium]|nr:MAG: plastocyanin [Actinomycetota bacterium]